MAFIVFLLVRFIKQLITFLSRHAAQWLKADEERAFEAKSTPNFTL